MLNVFESSRDLKGKTIIVTGGSGGIGKECVREFAKRNGRVIIASKNMEKGKRAVKEIEADFKMSNEHLQSEIIVKQLDLSSIDSIKEFSYHFNKGRLYFLIRSSFFNLIIASFKKIRGG